MPDQLGQAPPLAACEAGERYLVASAPIAAYLLDLKAWSRGVPVPTSGLRTIRREPMTIGERRAFRMAWIFGPDLTFQAQPQAYTRLADRLYLFESLDESGFRAELPVDEEGIVVDYPELFRRVPIMVGENA